VCDLENLKNEEAMIRVGSQQHKKKLHMKWNQECYTFVFQPSKIEFRSDCLLYLNRFREDTGILYFRETHSYRIFDEDTRCGCRTVVVPDNRDTGRIRVVFDPDTSKWCH
jgi:hypothetical protein